MARFEPETPDPSRSASTDQPYRDAHDYRDSGMMGGHGAAGARLTDAQIAPATPDSAQENAPKYGGRFGYGQLTPELDPRDRRSDGQLREAIYAALHDERGIDTRSIEVQVHGGQVDLSGSVPSPEQISRIQNRVRRLRGVLGLSNRLTVKPLPATAHPTDLPTKQLTTGQHATGETATMGIPGSSLVDDETSEGRHIAENNRQ